MPHVVGGCRMRGEEEDFRMRRGEEHSGGRDGGYRVLLWLEWKRREALLLWSFGGLELEMR